MAWLQRFRQSLHPVRHRIGAFFIIMTKTNIKFKLDTWKRMLPENMLSDAATSRFIKV